VITITSAARVWPLYEFDRSLFGIEEMSPEEILVHARTVAEKIAGTL
jgi:hypothetical protein